MKTLSDLFYDSAAAQPEKLAVSCDGQTATYGELADRVSRYSNFLLSAGVRYRDHIGIPMNNSIESVALIMTAANLGIALAPINSTMPLAAIQTAFKAGHIKHLIARKVFFDQCAKSGGGLVEDGVKICLDGNYEGALSLSDADSASTQRTTIPITGGETFILTMTSGSTGAPKPINLTQDNKLKRALAHITLYSITKDDNVLAATPLYHSLAERLVIVPLLLGGTSVLLPRFTPELWLRCVKEQQVTFTIAVSAQLSQISRRLSTPLVSDIDSLRCVVSSSALLEPHVRNHLIEKLQCDFHEMYGTSEVSTVTSINFKETVHKKQSVGRPLLEVEVRILKDDEQPCGFCEIGEIACKSSLMCDGYYGMPAMMDTAMADGYFKTGDLGYLDEDGYLYFSGRKKELIITGGINVYPPDIEKCVGEIPQVSGCAAFAYPDERLGEVVAVAIVIKNGDQLKKRTVQVQCARNLADFQQPHKIFFVDALPENAMGKPVKSKLMEYVRLHC